MGKENFKKEFVCCINLRGRASSWCSSKNKKAAPKKCCLLFAQPSVAFRCNETAELKNVLDNVVKTVNEVKSQVMTSRLFKTLCENMVSEFEHLLHTEVSRAGLRGGNGDNCPGLSDPRGPPWWHLFVLNKIFVWKIVVIQKKYKNATLYFDVAVSIVNDFSASLTFCQF